MSRQIVRIKGKSDEAVPISVAHFADDDHTIHFVHDATPFELNIECQALVAIIQATQVGSALVVEVESIDSAHAAETRPRVTGVGRAMIVEAGQRGAVRTLR